MAQQAIARWERTLRKMALNLVMALNKVYGSIGGMLYTTTPGQAPRRGAARHTKPRTRASNLTAQRGPARKRHARESHSNRG